MRLCCVDTECTGLSPTNDRIIEVAAVTYCTTSAAVLFGVHFLIPTSERNGAVHLNNISASALQQPAIPSMVDSFKHMYADADCIVAHNADFDRRFITAHWPDLPRKPWICTQKDIAFPKAGNGKCRKLNHLAVDHDVPVFGAHRAMADSITLVTLLSKCTNLEGQIRRVLSLPPKPGTDAMSKRIASVTPFPAGAKVLYEVVESRYDPAKNQEYKAAGFRWVPEAKRWRKEIPKGQGTSFSFEVRPAQAPSHFSAPPPPTAQVPSVSVSGRQDIPITAASSNAPSAAGSGTVSGSSITSSPVGNLTTAGGPFGDPVDEPAQEQIDSDDDWSL